MPKGPSDAHLAYPDTPAALVRTLSVHVTKTLSKNLSCQHENHLLQIATSGTGLGLRGAKVTVHEHFDGSQELLWKKRKLTYSVMDKPQRQSPVADGKSVNAQDGTAQHGAQARTESSLEKHARRQVRTR